MIAAASAGYQAIAFDFRGYGLSEHPAEPEKAKLLDLVDDVVGLIDSLSITKVCNNMCYTIQKNKKIKTLLISPISIKLHECKIYRIIQS